MLSELIGERQLSIVLASWNRMHMANSLWRKMQMLYMYCLHTLVAGGRGRRVQENDTKVPVKREKY